MEYRQLGNSGLKVSVLTMGTMTFGGKGNFAKVGNLQLDEVRKLITSSPIPASISSTPRMSIPAAARKS